jgi:hypothetical protein
VFVFIYIEKEKAKSFVMSFQADRGALSTEQEQLRYQQYLLLEKRIGHLLTTSASNGVGGTLIHGVNHLQSLWCRFGGHPKWQELLSPDQLSLLLSFDERGVFRTESEDASLRPGFVECVLSRLPCLTTCALTNVEFACCYPELFAPPLLCPQPFPALQHLDLRRSTVRDTELVALVRIMPRLETCDVRGCFNVTWRGLEEARQAAGAMGHPPLQTRPASEEEKTAEHDWAMALYGHHLNKAEGGILALWREVQADEDGNCWNGMLNSAQLNMLLNHDTREVFRIESTLDKENGLLSDTMEEVLSRLPKLATLTLRSMRIRLSPGLLMTVPNPFPSLKELCLDMTDIENRYVQALAVALPNLELLSLKGCFNVSWRVMELVRATCGPKLRVLPDTREEKVDADAAVFDILWSNVESLEARVEYSRLQREFGAILRKMQVTESTNGPWPLWKELGGMHCWRTHLRPAQLTLLLSRDETTTINFSVDVQDRSSNATTTTATSQASLAGTATTATSGTSGATNTSSWSVITDPSSGVTNAVTFDAGEVRAYFSHVVARLPALTELNLDGCPVWPFMWKLEDDHVNVPFPQLRRVRLRNMTCHAKDLRDLVRHIPSLEKGAEDSTDNGILVDAAYVLYDDYSGSKLRQMCCGKVSVCHPDGSWHPLGNKI